MTISTANKGETAKNAKPPVISLDQMADIAARLKAIATNLGGSGDYNAIAPTLDQNTLGIFKLVVLGEIKKGKSSLINSLLGEDTPVVPVAQEVATSTVFKIIYGRERITKVFFQPDLETGLEKPPLQISEEEIVEYGTEKGNPGNIKGVDFIGIEIANLMLATGLVIIDTPGLGGLVKTHRDITWRYLPNADAVCFVTDSVSEVLNHHEISFLEELVSRVTRRLFFVQTKTDAADVDKVLAWRKRNIEILCDKLGLEEKQIRYFCVSSVLKDAAKENKDLELAAMSGYPQLRQFLDDGLIKLKDRELARRCVGLLAPVAEALSSEVVNRLAIVAADEVQQVNALKGEFEKSRKDLLKFRSEEIPRMKTAAQDGLIRLRTRLDDRFCAALVDAMDEFQRKLESKSAEELFKSTEQIGSDMVGEVNALLVRHSKSAIQEINEFFDDLLGSDVPGGECVGSVEKSIARDAAQVAIGNHLSSDIFAAVRGASMGGGAVLVVAKLLVVTFNPLLAIAAALGGGWMMWSMHKGKKREEILQKTKNVGREIQLKARDLWQRELRLILEEASTSVQRATEMLVESKQSALEANLKLLEERRGQTIGQVKESKQILESIQKEIADCREQMAALK